MATILKSYAKTDIAKIEILVTNCQKSLAEIAVMKPKADLIVNGGLYSGPYEPNGFLKVNGQRLAFSSGYNPLVFGWDNGDDIAYFKTNEQAKLSPEIKQNYIGGFDLVVDNKPLSNINCPEQIKSARPRTAIALTGKGLAIYCTNKHVTPEYVAKYLHEAGCWAATLLDGGEHSQALVGSQKVAALGSAKVHNWLLVYLKKEAKEKIATNDNLALGYGVARVYSAALHSKQLITPNFAINEFACKDGSLMIAIHQKLPPILQQIRDNFKRPMTISSAYRSYSHNKAVGGAANSYHMYGMAADCYISGISPKEIGAYARQIMPDYGGIGIYNSFVHIDVGEKRDWQG